MLKHITEDDISRIRKKLKEEAKLIRTGKKRSFFLAEYMPGKTAVEFVSLQHQNFNKRFKEENERAWAYLNDKENAEKFGFYDERDFRVGGKHYVEGSRNQMPNQKPEQIVEWASKAYPTIDEDLWAFELEVETFNKEMDYRGLELLTI